MNDRTGYLTGVARIIDTLEQNPDLTLPYNGTSSPLAIYVDRENSTRELHHWAALMTDRKQEQSSVSGTDWLTLSGYIDGVHVHVNARTEDIATVAGIERRPIYTVPNFAEPELSATAPIPTEATA